MDKISLKFDSIEQCVDINIESDANAEFFFQRLKTFSRPADRIFYVATVEETKSMFMSKAQKAKEIFGLDWNLNQLNQDSFNSWHRDIENFDLSKHPPWSQEKGDFFIDLHHWMHQMEGVVAGSHKRQRNHIQIKWFDSSPAWPCPPQMISQNELEVGDVYADFPHVGKDPWTCVLQNDNRDLKQSCRLKDACPPGFIIVLNKPPLIDLHARKQKLIEWYNQHLDQLSDLFDLERLLQHDGYHKLGKIDNLENLSLLKTLNLSSVSVI